MKCDSCIVPIFRAFATVRTERRSLVDGTTTVEEIVDLSGMPRHEALRLLAELLDGGAIVRLG